MKIIAATGQPDIATVYLAEMANGKYIEFVESVQPPIPKEEKWVLIVSTLYGCPVGCAICDAGGWYEGRLSKEDILAQIDYVVTKYFPNRQVPVKKFKIQFARMGDPALNPHVLDVLERLPFLYNAPGLMASISTIAPEGSDAFFKHLPFVKCRHYSNGRFQLQFSIHTTDTELRDRLIPVKKWSFKQIADYCEGLYTTGDRKTTLNFALAQNVPISPDIMTQYFDPYIFAIKITPVNPTFKAAENNIINGVNLDSPGEEPPIVNILRREGYEVILSIGELEENKIGSNCGQYVKRMMANS
ncbi:MAG: radical SAM protein [Candidatus Omnitrophota bacterium]